MGFSVPTGSNVNGNGHALFTPTLAAGKGFGDFSVQSTVGVTFPNGGHDTLDRLGMPVAFNTAFQYRICKYFWPEFETNYTWQSYGGDTGHSTLYLTPGTFDRADSDSRPRRPDVRRRLPGRGDVS